MKFIILKDNPEYYDIVLPYFYEEWKDIYNKNNIHNIQNLKTLFENRLFSKTFILLNKNNKFIGSFTLSKINNKIFFENFFVIPSMRNKKIGSYMLDYAINITNQDLYVHSYKNTLGFYINKKFIIKNKTNNPNNLNDTLYLLKHKKIYKNIFYYYLIYIIIFIILIFLIIILFKL